MTILSLPIDTPLTLELLLSTMASDLQHAKEIHRQAREEYIFLPAEVVAVYAQQEKRLKTALDVVRFYLETLEEAAVVDVDEPLPIEVTEAGYKAV